MRARPPALPWPRRPAARALAGAGVLGTLRRSLARHAARALALRRFAGWLRALTGPAPTLAEDERLGMLPTLVGDGPPHRPEDERRTGRGHTGSRGARSRRTRRRGGARDRDRHPRRVDAAAGVDPGGGARAVAPLADAALRSAARPALPRAATVVRHPLPPAAAGAARARRAGSERKGERGRRSRRASPRARSGAAGPAVDLAEALAARAESRLPAAIEAAAVAMGTGGPAFHGSARAPRSQGVDAPPAASGVAGALAKQWGMPVGGRTAPADLLWRLVNDPASGAGGAPPSAMEGDGPPATHVPAATDAVAGRRERSPDAGDPFPVATRRDAPPLPPPLETSSPGGPPAPLRALSAEVPARDLGAPGEAAARLRLAMGPDTQPEEDLEQLAVNVKRILDREARRHGIDV